jgi:hypothetical protein
MSYDLRRLRLAGLIHRTEHTNRYVLTPDGIAMAVFHTKLHNRLLRPLMAARQPQAPPPLRDALHAIDPHAIVATLMDAVPPGSYLVVSHMGSDLVPPQTQQEMSSISHRVSQQQYSNRSREQVAQFFTGADLVEPGLVRVEEWRPEPGSTGTSALWGAVGRKQ